MTQTVSDNILNCVVWELNMNSSDSSGLLTFAGTYRLATVSEATIPCCQVLADW